MYDLSVLVPGEPIAKGSAKFLGKNKEGKAIVRQDNAARQKPWADAIKWIVGAKNPHSKPHAGPVRIKLQFFLPRPARHYGTGKNSRTLKQKAPYLHTNKPDLDKLVRCVKDALTGEIWKDDCQCVEVVATKVYGDLNFKEGCLIEIKYEKEQE